MVLATGIYTVFGGLSAVIYTELLQAVVLIAGALTLTVIGLSEAGGLARACARRCRPTSST